MKKNLILVAGGLGKRMNQELPKQFIVIGKKPLIVHTIENFVKAVGKINIVVVINRHWIEYWKELQKAYCSDLNITTAEGGPARFHSVKNGLLKIEDNESVTAIHDAVRPLVRTEVIVSAFKEAEIFGNAIPAVPINETLRYKEKNHNHNVDRAYYYIIQTPQCFQTKLIKNAYRINFDEKFTDDAMVLEETGIKIRLIEGNYENIKITRPSDLKFAECVLDSY